MPTQTVPATPKKGLRRFPTRVAHISRPSDSLALVRLEFNPGTEFKFRAGQWAYVFAPSKDGEQRNPYSIASAPSIQGHIDFSVKKVIEGGVADWLYHRNVGDPVEVSQALGSFEFTTPADRTAVFLATGTGIAPFRSMLHQLWHDGDRREKWLFLGSGHKIGLPWHEEWLELAKHHKNFHYVPTLSKADTYEWTGERGWIQEPFLRRFRGRTDFDAYVCGIRLMVDDVRQLLRSSGIPDAQVHTERYD